MSSSQQQHSNPNGDALYKGISCPMTIGQYVDFKKMADEMILGNLKKGVPINTLGDLITKQMDGWVEKLNTRVRCSETTGSKTGTKKFVAKWIKACGLSETEMLIQWNVNVHALLKLKRIPHNEHFGIHNAPQQAIKSSVASR